MKLRQPLKLSRDPVDTDEAATKAYVDANIGAGGRDKSYMHTQATADTMWTVTHNLGKYPSVSILDSALTEVEGDVVGVNIFLSGVLELTA